MGTETTEGIREGIEEGTVEGTTDETTAHVNGTGTTGTGTRGWTGTVVFAGAHLHQLVRASP